MIVLQVLPSLVAGGVERGTVEITQAVLRAGGTALVASAGGRMVGAVQRAGGHHAVLPLASKDPLTMWWNARRLARIVREHKVDIVHARSRAPAWSALLAARRTGAQFVTTYHGAYGEDLPGKRRYNAVMAKGDRVIAISQFIAGLIAERHAVPPERLRVIPRGVDLMQFDPAVIVPDRLARVARAWRLPDGMRSVVLPARLTRWKGHEVLIDAIARLSRADVCCVLVGPDQGHRAYTRSLAARAEKLGIADRVRIAGACDDMPAAMMLSDVVVHASVRPEPFGRVVIEAQAMGRPVIATDHGGPAETIRTGDTGWRVPPGDVAALAATIDYVLSLPEPWRAELGVRARAAVASAYTVEAMQAATVAVYRELV